MSIRRILVMSRPRFWSYLAGPYLIGYTLAANSIDSFFTLPFLYTLFYFLIPANLFLYGINDYFDRDVDRKNPKKTSYESRVTVDEMPAVLNFTLISLIFTLPLFAYMNAYGLAILLCFLLLSAFYSVPPIRFKTMPFFDSASNMLYILPGLLGFAQISPSIVSFSTLVYLSCWPAAMHLFSAIPDIDADRGAKINTSATYFRKTWSLTVCLLLWLIFAVFATSVNPLFVVSFMYPSIPLYLLYHHDVSIESVYRKFPLFNTFIGTILFAYLFITQFYR